MAEFDERISGSSRYQVRCWDLRDGRETIQVLGRIAAVTADQVWVHALDLTKPLRQVRQAWDYSGRQLREMASIGGVAPDVQTLVRASKRPHPARDWITSHGIRWPFSQSEVVQRQLIDVKTEQVIADLPSWTDRSRVSVVEQVGFAPDSQLYAEPIDGAIRIWDIPPHKSFTWLLVGSALLALLLAALAEWRQRGDRKSVV